MYKLYLVSSIYEVSFIPIIHPYKISLPGSSSNTDFTLSKNALARFSSPLSTVTLKIFVVAASPGSEVATLRWAFEQASCQIVCQEYQPFWMVPEMLSASSLLLLAAAL